MVSSIKDKHIILGFIFVVICIISYFAANVITVRFEQDTSQWFVVFLCCNLLVWLLYLVLQYVIYNIYEIYQIKFGKKNNPIADRTYQENESPESTDPLQDTSPASIETMPDSKPVELHIDSESYEANRYSYETKQKQEEEKRVRMVMEYIHYIMPSCVDQDTINHICNEVSMWTQDCDYTPTPILKQLQEEINSIALRHFVWNISERFVRVKLYTGEKRAYFIKSLFPHIFSDIEISTIKNFKIEPLKGPIPIDEPQNGKLDFHYPEDYYKRKKESDSIDNQ